MQNRKLNRNKKLELKLICVTVMMLLLYFADSSI